jgi:hypothetical protein
MTQKELQVKVYRLEKAINRVNRIFQELVVLAASDGDIDYDADTDMWTKVGKPNKILPDNIEFREN